MNEYRPDWIGAIGAGIATLTAIAITKSRGKGRLNGPRFYAVLGVGTFVIALAAREVLRLFGV